MFWTGWSFFLEKLGTHCFFRNPNRAFQCSSCWYVPCLQVVRASEGIFHARANRPLHDALLCGAVARFVALCVVKSPGVARVCIGCSMDYARCPSMQSLFTLKSVYIWQLTSSRDIRMRTAREAGPPYRAHSVSEH